MLLWWIGGSIATVCLLNHSLPTKCGAGCCDGSEERSAASAKGADLVLSPRSRGGERGKEGRRGDLGQFLPGGEETVTQRQSC